MSRLPFAQRACFIAGQAKSGTTLLAALLDNHPQLLVLPEETAYFATALTKYARNRRAQFDYLTKHSRSRPLFDASFRGKSEYNSFPREEFRSTFEQSAFDPAKIDNDLLALMAQSYALTLDVPLDRIKRWVERTPANRNHIPEIHSRFPNAKILVTMRDPRAILAAQIAITAKRQRRDFSVYYVIAHWRVAAKLARRVNRGELPGLAVKYEELVIEPARTMQKVCDYLEVTFEPRSVLTPTKLGRAWTGNSATQTGFSRISTEPVARWQGELSEDEIGWVEWHCRDLMREFGYEPRLANRALRHWAKPIRGEPPSEYLKSRAYSLRDDWLRRS